MTNETQQTTEQPSEIFTSAPSAEPAFQDDVNQLRSENDQLRSEIRLMHAREEIVSALATENALPRSSFSKPAATASSSTPKATSTAPPN